MKAYSRYLERQKSQEVKNVVMENCDAYIEHMDLIVLSILHTEEGFGAKRLRRVYQKIYRRFMEYKRYMGDSKTKFNDGIERDDTYALKYHLRQIGFDYDEEVKLAMQENDDEQ